METTERKLKKIIEEIGKKQLARFDEKSRKHNPGTEYDVASDNYNWNKLQTYYWTNEAFYHFYKWHDIEQKRSEAKDNQEERMKILDLMNVFTALYHKLELED